jgi:hypothetical protein
MAKSDFTPFRAPPPSRRRVTDPRAIAALIAHGARLGRELVTIETNSRGETVAYVARSCGQAVRS